MMRKYYSNTGIYTESWGLFLHVKYLPNSISLCFLVCSYSLQGVSVTPHRASGAPSLQVIQVPRSFLRASKLLG